MLSNPTVRNINPLMFQTGTCAVKKLILTLAIHDKNVTMTKSTRALSTVQAGLAPPFEKNRSTKAYRDNKLVHSRPLKQRLIIAVPIHPRLTSPIKVQIHSRRHFPLRTPRLHQGSDSPPQPREQFPTLLPRVWPDSWTVPIRI